MKRKLNIQCHVIRKPYTYIIINENMVVGSRERAEKGNKAKSTGAYTRHVLMSKHNCIVYLPLLE